MKNCDNNMCRENAGLDALARNGCLLERRPPPRGSPSRLFPMKVISQLIPIQNWTPLARQARWSAGKLAKLCDVSRETLRQHFLKHFGKLPGAWLNEQRQHEAIALLRDGSTIKETAACLGYKQQTNFTRQFKEYWGMCPTQAVPKPAGARIGKMINHLRK